MLICLWHSLQRDCLVPLDFERQLKSLSSLGSLHLGQTFIWRKVQDLNLWGLLHPSSLANCHHRPLGQLSVTNLYHIMQRFLAVLINLTIHLLDLAINQNSLLNDSALVFLLNHRRCPPKLLQRPQ